MSSLGSSEYEILVQIRDAVNNLDTFEKKTKDVSHGATKSFGSIAGSITGLASNVASLGFGFDNLSKLQLRVEQASQKVEKAQKRVNDMLKDGKTNTDAYRIATEDLRLAEERESQAKSDQFQNQFQLGLALTTFAASTLPNAIKGLSALFAGTTASTIATGAHTAATWASTIAIRASTFAMLFNPLTAAAVGLAAAAAVIVLATNTLGMRDAVFGVTAAVKENTGVLEKQNFQYDQMGNKLEDHSGLLEAFTSRYESNTDAIEKNTIAIEQNVGARGNLKKKNNELAQQARDSFLRPPWGITTIGTTGAFRTVDSAGNIIPEAIVPFFGLNTMTGGQRTINVKTGQGMIKTYDSTGRILFWETDNGTYFDSSGQISIDKVKRLIKGPGTPSKGGESSAFNFVQDPDTGIIRAIPKGASGRNITPSLNLPLNNFGQNSGRINEIGLEGAARDMAAKSFERSLGKHLLSAHLSGKSMLGGQGSLGARVSQLGKAGINLAGGGFGRGTVGTAGGGRKRGKGRGNVNIRAAQSMLREAQLIHPSLIELAGFMGISLPSFPRFIELGRGSVRDAHQAFFANAAMNANNSQLVRDAWIKQINDQLNDMSNLSGYTVAQVKVMQTTLQGRDDLTGVIDFNKRRNMITSGVV